MTVGLLSFANPAASTAPFQGNPNTTISAISGAIAISRTTVATPGFVQVSAAAFSGGTGAGISCTGTRTLGSGTSSAVPYEDLEFSWDFGDPTGTEIFTRPTDGASVNANKQVGPEAIYCYRTAGPYTITLTVRGKNGGGYTTATFTQAVTVNAFVATNGTRYVDTVNGNNSWTGTLTVPTPSITPTDGPWADLTNFGTFQLTTGNKALYIAQGSHISGTTGISFTQNGTSNWRVGSYVGVSGAGANPIVEITSGTNTAIQLGNPSNSGTRDDFVISNIQAVLSTSATGGTVAGFTYSVTGTGIMSNIYFDNCIIKSTLASQVSDFITLTMNGTGGTSQFWGVWGGSIISPIYTTGSGQKHGFFGGPLAQGLSFYGVSFTGSGSSNILDHHIYPETQAHSVYKWLSFGATGAGTYQRSYCINTNFDNYINPTLPSIAQYHLISESNFTGVTGATTANTAFMHDLDNSDNNPNQVQFTNVVVEKNAVANMTGGYISLFQCGKSYSFRDNRIWNNFAGGIVVEGGASSGIFVPSIYRNKIYIPSSANTGQLFGDLNALQPVTFNISDTNIYFSPGLVSYTAPGTAVNLVGASLPTGFNNSTIYYVVNSYMVRSQESVAIFNLSTPDILAPCMTGFPLNTQVQFQGGTLPSGGQFALSTNYFIVSKNATNGTIQLSATRNGSVLQATGSVGGGSIGIGCYALTLGTSPAGPAIQATSTGSGSITMQPQWIVKPKTLTDNIIWDARATPEVIGEVFADQETALSLYDRNQYWQAGASSTTNFFNNNGSSEAFGPSGTAGTWQNAGFDPNGSVAAPSWPSYPTAPAQWSDFGP